MAKLEFKLRTKLTSKTIFFPHDCKVILSITEHFQCAGHRVRHWGAQAQFLRRKELGFELGLAQMKEDHMPGMQRSVSMDTETRTSLLLLLLLSHASCVRPCVTPQMAAHQAPPSLGLVCDKYTLWVRVVDFHLWLKKTWLQWKNHVFSGYNYKGP